MNVPTTETSARALTLVPRPYNHPDAAELVAELYREQTALYGFADPPEANTAADFTPPDGTFLVGYHEDQPVACGGSRRLSLHTVEVKRMYVRPHHRGRRHGTALLTALEQAASQHGAHLVVLETGARNHEALALYTRAGYRPIPTYVPGRDATINRALAKHLTSHH